MNLDPKRTDKASRIYQFLLNLYPSSFQLKYREMLTLQFQDEYQERSQKENIFSQLQFWMFILFDFAYSLLVEYSDAVLRRVKPKTLIATSETERIGRGCQVYGQLMMYYPISFRRNHGERLTSQFKNEYQKLIEEKKYLHLVFFWVSTGYNFIRTYLSAYQEQLAEKANKDIFVFSAIAAGAFSLMGFLNGVFGITQRLRYGGLIGVVGMVGVYLFPLFVLFEFLTLLGLIKTSLKKMFFQLIGALLLILVGYFVIQIMLTFILVFSEWEWVRTIMHFRSSLFENAERALTYVIYSRYVFIGVFGIGALIKRKWVPAACLLVISRPWVIVPYVLYFNIGWLKEFALILSAVAYIGMSWWLMKENSTVPSIKGRETT